jgi:hypothetical protein
MSSVEWASHEGSQGPNVKGCIAKEEGMSSKISR